MIYNNYSPRRNYSGFGASDGDVATWCQNKFPNDPTLQAKCSANNFPISISPPWTDLGAILRGIPKSSALVDLVNAGAGGSTYPPGYIPPPVDPGIFGIPTTILVAGGAVLAIGVGAMVLSKRKRPAVNGLGRYKHGRRRSKRSRR